MSRWKQYALSAWTHPAFRVALALLAGSLLGQLCGFAPTWLQAPCHMAAQILHRLGQPLNLDPS